MFNSTDKKRIKSLVKEHVLIGEYAALLKKGEKYERPDRNVIKKEQELYLKSIDFSKDYVAKEIPKEDEPPRRNEKKASKVA